jgi:predicted O-methyltransferase YrrM
MNNKSVRALIYREIDPYSHLEIAKKAPIQGWGGFHRVLSWAVAHLRPNRIIEIGSWKGQSAIFMALASLRLNLETEIVCVDTWLGSLEHWDSASGDKTMFESLSIKHGYPTLIQAFLTNVKSYGVDHVITPCPMPSSQAAKFLKKHQYSAPLIYIDGSHEYADVMSDLESYWELLEEKGIMILDDYLIFDGVTHAVHDFVARNRINFVAERGKALLFSNSSTPLSTVIGKVVDLKGPPTPIYLDPLKNSEPI